MNPSAMSNNGVEAEPALGVGYNSCGQPDAHELWLYETCSYWLEGVLLVGVGCVGILANLLAIRVISQQAGSGHQHPATVNRIFNRLLVVLAVFDLIFIVLTMINYALARVFFWPWPAESQIWLYLVPKVVYPLNNVFFCCSVYMTVIIAWERYKAVCHPTHYRRSSARDTKSRGCNFSVAGLVYVIPVILFSVVFNIPTLFETEFYSPENITTSVVDAMEPLHPMDTFEQLVAEGEEVGGEREFVAANISDLKRSAVNDSLDLGQIDDNVTVTAMFVTLGLRVSDLRNNYNYIKYYIFLTRLLATGVFPCAALIYFYTRIFAGIRIIRQRITARQHYSRHLATVITGNAASSNSRSREEMSNQAKKSEIRGAQLRTEVNLAVVLTAIVMVFLVCNVPRLLLDILEFSLWERFPRCGDGRMVSPGWFHCFTASSHLLLVTNSSANFFVYCCFNEEVQRMARQMVARARSLMRRLVAAKGLLAACNKMGERNGGGNQPGAPEDCEHQLAETRATTGATLLKAPGHDIQRDVVVVDMDQHEAQDLRPPGELEAPPQQIVVHYHTNSCSSFTSDTDGVSIYRT